MQMGSFFVMQGANMDRNMFGGRFVIPSASLSLFNTISIITLIPIYDRGVVPLLQRFGVKITHLQRIGKAQALRMHVSFNCCVSTGRQSIGGCTACILGRVHERSPCERTSSVRCCVHGTHDLLRQAAWLERAELWVQAGACLCACCPCWRGALWRWSGWACSSRAMC